MKVIFFPNGNTICLDDDGQVPHLQKSYMQLYCEFLETQDENPEDFIFLMPNNKLAKAVKTKSGSWNWRFI